MNIQYPKITGKSSEEQLVQIRSYLYRLAEQLNMETGIARESQSSSLGQNGRGGGSLGNGAAQEGKQEIDFNQLKSLIIKSAEFVEAYSEEVEKQLRSGYVAVSEFGTYKETAAANFKETAKAAIQEYSQENEILSQLDMLIKTKANIRTGELFVVSEKENLNEMGVSGLENGTPVYGVEVGQTTTKTVDGADVDIFEKFARFTAYGMALYDNNGILSAYITDNKLNIPNAVVKSSLTRGGFIETINADGSSVERWAGV